MSDWKRSTGECAFEDLQPDVREALAEHIRRYNLGDILSETVMCVVTTSEKVKKGLFGAEEAVVVAALLTPRWLVWAIRGERPGIAVMSARLADIVVQDYADTRYARMVPDIGIEVSGSFTDVAERGSAFLGLGREPASHKFRKTLLEAVQSAKQ